MLVPLIVILYMKKIKEERLTLKKINLLSLMTPSKTDCDIKDASELHAISKNYFKICIEQNRLPTMTGLAMNLGTSRSDLLTFCSADQEMNRAVETAKQVIIEHVERLLLSGRPPIGLIFWLKNNADWIDKREIEHSDKKISDILDELDNKNSDKAGRPVIDGEIVQQPQLTTKEEPKTCQ